MSDQKAGLGTIVTLCRDAFFGIRISNTLNPLGYRVKLVKTTVELLAAAESEQAPVLAVIDLNSGVDWEAVSTRSDSALTVPLLVYGSHTDVAGLRAAKSAGATRVVS